MMPVNWMCCGEVILGHSNKRDPLIVRIKKIRKGP